VDTKKDAMFRQKKVNDAIAFLLKNNPLFANEWGLRPYVPHDESVAEHPIPEEDMVDLTEEEASAIESDLQNSDSLASADSNIVLYHSNHEIVNRNDRVVQHLQGSPKKGKAKLTVPRDPRGLVHPSFDSSFYEKCFPSLYPYGFGGPNDTHGLSMGDYTELLLKRGGTLDTRRFGKCPAFMIAVYSYKMKKITKLRRVGRVG